MRSALTTSAGSVAASIIEGSASLSAGLPPTAALHAATGGATLPGQNWWTGSSGPLMIPVTPTGATTASSAGGYAPSPPRYKTATASAGRCFSSPGPSTSAPPSGSWQQVSATCATGVADHDGSHLPR